MDINEAFVRLMQVAREDQEIKNRLTMILRLDPFNRKSLLNSYISKMKLKKAPNDFIEALTYLLDEAIARKALEIIENDK
jgi:hypothetical protein